MQGVLMCSGFFISLNIFCMVMSAEHQIPWAPVTLIVADCYSVCFQHTTHFECSAVYYCYVSPVCFWSLQECCGHFRRKQVHFLIAEIFAELSHI